MQSIDKEPVTIDTIIGEVKSYQPKANLRLIQRAYELALSAHKGQKRVSGEEYIIHPLHVAQILTELHIDDITIAASLLHDVVEDTIYTTEQLEQMFGKEVAELVDGVTKLSRIKYKSREEQQLETYRKMFLAMAKDIRVIMIKLADRLHNMRRSSSASRKRPSKSTRRSQTASASRTSNGNSKTSACVISSPRNTMTSSRASSRSVRSARPSSMTPSCRYAKSSKKRRSKLRFPAARNIFTPSIRR